MKRIIVICFTILAATGCAVQDKEPGSGGLSAIVLEQRSPADQPLSGTDVVIVKATATVKDLDLATRMLTLLDSDGSELELKVSEEVRRLDEVKPGDQVVLEYMQSVVFEVRPITAAERADPAIVSLAAGRADRSMPPAAGVVQKTRAVVTVAAIDKTAGTATFTWPNGASQTIKAKYPENLDRAKVGDTVVLNYTEGVALRLNPAKAQN